MVQPSRSLRVSFWLCVAISAVAMNTCLHIEYWNSRAGGLLPRELPEEGNAKWRWAPRGRMGHEMWARWIRARDMDPNHHTQEEIERMLERPLTEQEEAEIAVKQQKDAIENRLHSWVSGPGLLQYLLAPLAAVWAWALRTRAQPIAAGSAVWVMRLSGILCVIMMFVRGYFTSLGW